MSWVRPARTDEAEVLLAIQRDAAVAAYGHIFPAERFPFPDDGVRAQWDERLADAGVEVIVAERAGNPVGVIACAPESLEALYVQPRAQGEGVGSLLHDEALARRRSRGDAFCRLWTLEENRAGRCFYERRGWRLDGRTRVVPFPPHPLDVGYTIRL